MRIFSALCLLATITGCGGGSSPHPSEPTSHDLGSTDGAGQPDADGATTIEPPATGTITSASFSPTDENFPNPERGFYILAGSLLDPKAFESNVEVIVGGTTGATTEKLSLVYGETTLPTTDLTASQLAAIDTSFGEARNNGAKVLVRFNYCEDESAPCEPDLAQVQKHTQQLAPVLEANKDVLYAVQAGFIGAYGEWAYSPAGLDTRGNKDAVRAAVLAMTPNEISVNFTQVYPMQEDWFAGLGPLDASQAFSGSAQGRSGFHDDCYLTGQGDSSTYPGPQTIKDFTITTSRLDERMYVAALTEYAPFGGETCVGSQGANAQVRQDCTGDTDESGLSGGILNEGPRYHLAYLNRTYSLDFVNTWIDQGCYDTVASHMGYRFQLDAIRHVQAPARGSALTVELDVRDVGWARMYSARVFDITLVSKSSGKTLTGAHGFAHDLPSQATSTTTIAITVPIPSDADVGDYDVFVSLPDVFPTTASDARYAVRFANADDPSQGQAWDATKGRFATGTVVTVQ